MPLVPTGRLVLLLCAPAALALASVLAPELTAALLAADGALLVAALLDAVLASRRFIEVTRETPEVFSLGRPNRVTLHLRSRADRALDVQLQDDLFEHGLSEDLPARFRVEPGAALQVAYHVEPRRRGAFTLGDHHVRFGSPLGLWTRQYRCPAKDTVRVYPDLQSLRAYDLLARRDRQDALVRAVRLRGGENEFERLRDYTTDDEFRSVDWKATARRQRLTAREYQLESNQSLLFLLDTGRMMTGTVSGISQLDLALNAALMLAHVAARAGDYVGLAAFDESVRRFVAPAAGPHAVERLIRASYDLHPRLVESDYDQAFDLLGTRLKRRSLVILFTQLADEASAARALRRVRASSRKHLTLVVPFVDTEVEALVAGTSPSGDGPYVRAAAAELLQWRDGLVRRLRAAGAHVLDVEPSALTSRLVGTYLEIKARHQL